MLDIGTGDGRFVLDQAKKDPEKLCIGIDPVAEAMAESSARAVKKPQRGGLPNALFVCSNIENPPQELIGIATEITINYPWGSLLRALILPDLSILQTIANLARPNAAFTLLINYSIFSDKDYLTRLELPHFDIDNIEQLINEYRQSSLQIEKWALLDKEVPHRTTWGQKLTHGSTRSTLLLKGRIIK